MTAKQSKDQPKQQGELEFEQDSLESALERLEEIVARMDSEDVELEESIELFQEGMQLTKFCRAQISEAEQKVQQVVEDADGNLTLEEFDDE
ncbi:MAG: exodeoxyribonuclease VII small subunit [Candidatus Marinimicrobia bacterium]|nr:exodeoxyribonuclease VII small subunit [Candidatus Neomarinimicrobiota bacterium]MCF7830350.1 exodeoxyribonuclease VII small subunit [Candidatus Neomarinimicrobiota bacterium]MCF7882446.1 exodeoxyribonuclease VII small subunit [Candidatus Neomarinimicrobiota bacterium]